MSPDHEHLPILASDADRERGVAQMREAVGEGRLTLEEFSPRVEIAQTARTDAELRVHNVFGTVTVLAPEVVEVVEVVVDGGGLFASQKIESPERPPVAGGPRRFIRCSGLGGTVYVRSRPTWKALLKQAIKG